MNAYASSLWFAVAAGPGAANRLHFPDIHVAGPPVSDRRDLCALLWRRRAAAVAPIETGKQATEDVHLDLARSRTVIVHLRLPEVRQQRISPGLATACLRLAGLLGRRLVQPLASPGSRPGRRRGRRGRDQLRHLLPRSPLLFLSRRASHPTRADRCGSRRAADRPAATKPSSWGSIPISSATATLDIICRSTSPSSSRKYLWRPPPESSRCGTRTLAW